MDVIAYFRIRGNLPNVPEQNSALPDGAHVIESFYESSAVQKHRLLPKAIKMASEHGATLAIPCMFRDQKTLNLLKNSEIPIWPDVDLALEAAREHRSRVREGIQEAKGRGVKLGADREDWNPNWLNHQRAGRASADRRRKKAAEYYASVLPRMEELRAEGRGLREIAKTLNDEGYVTSAGYPYNLSSVDRVLKRFT